MNFKIKDIIKVLICILLTIWFFPLALQGQESQKNIVSYEDYAETFGDADDEYLSTLEEWQNMIDQWLEKPLCINNEEADWLMEYKIISLYQLNKLREYRLIYGFLLSVFELSFIDGWDFQTVRKVIPLVTVDMASNQRAFKKFSFRSFRHSLILKTSFNTQKSKGYKISTGDENETGDPMYTGPPARLAIRYDLEYRNRFSLGLRMEKDPGEPYLVASNSKMKNFKTPDLLSGYVKINRIGPVQSVIIGDYRISFGYGVNIAGGQSGIKGRSGMSGMASRVRPQTSVSEAGFFRGVAISAASGRFSLTGFASQMKIDGTSIETDSISGRPISFSSVNKAGLHRTLSELDQRKTITEKVYGGFLVYHHNWFKTGLIALYNQYDARVEPSGSPHARFDLKGRENFITGLSATAWLPGFQFFTEFSVSRNKGTAMITGLQLMPVPGALIVVTYRNFAVSYQNWYGAGFISSGRNSGENGIQAAFRVEMPKKWLIEIGSDLSNTIWVSYNLDAPSNRREIKILTEKAWRQSSSLSFSFRYLTETINNPEKSFWICHTMELSQYKLRLEGRIEAMPGIRLKSRLECNFVENLPPGWLIFQDIELTTKRFNSKIWLRTCFFDVMDFGSSIYAYENDVQYDFTSFMHYGKGLRGVVMCRISPLNWMDLWLRISTVYYTNKYIGSGWDEIEGNRQNEIEIQARISVPD